MVGNAFSKAEDAVATTVESAQVTSWMIWLRLADARMGKCDTIVLQLRHFCVLRHDFQMHTWPRNGTPMAVARPRPPPPLPL